MAENIPLDTNGLYQSSFNSIPSIWQTCTEQYGDSIAVKDPHMTPIYERTYAELQTEMENLAYALRYFGLQPGQSVGLFAEASPRWIVADQAVMMNAAFDAVRGSMAPAKELQQIVLNSDCVALILQDDKVLKALLDLENEETTTDLSFSQVGIFCLVEGVSFHQVLRNKIQFVVLLWGEKTFDTTNLNFPVFDFERALSVGRLQRTVYPSPLPEPKTDDVATIVYTSGTAGIPKGVVLTHRNILYQMEIIKKVLNLLPRNQFLSLLPPWHIYQRTISYYTFESGAHVVFGSVRTLSKDLVDHPSDVFVTVPLILQTLYKRVMSGLEASLFKRLIGLTLLKASMAFVTAMRVIRGKDIRFAYKPRPLLTFLCSALAVLILTPFHLLAQILVHKQIKAALNIRRLIISGGGSLIQEVDLFFEAIGIALINGWGLTESTSAASCRRPDEPRNIRGTIGLPAPGSEVKIVDPETFKDVPDGTKGLLFVKGPGIMKGYNKLPEETERVLIDGWLNTGDCGWKIPKDVPGSQMAGNIIFTGRLKDTIVLVSGKNVEPQPIEDDLQISPSIANIMVIGQDCRNLGALIVPNEELQKENVEDVHKTILQEIRKLERQNSSFMPYMRIADIQILNRPFSVEDGTLTRTMKVRRENVMKKYAADVQNLLSRLN